MKYKDLPEYKKKIYDELCDKVQELGEECERASKTNVDATEINKQFENALDKCIEFVRREFYNKY